MLNLIKMDLCRMIKTRSCWVILVIMLLVTAISTYFEVMDTQEAAAETAEAEANEQETTVNLGISVSVTTELGDHVTVLDMFYANAYGKLLGLYMVIFVILFSTADISSGYIKNIGGQVTDRWKLILSKAFSVLVYTIAFLGVYVLFQAFCNRIILGYLEWGSTKELLTYFGIIALLHYALVMICMAVAVLLRNNVFSMVFGVCLCMNVMISIYNMIDVLLAKIGIEDFSLLKYTVTGQMTLLTMEPTGQECMTAAAVAAAFIAASLLLGSVVFEKRDI